MFFKENSSSNFGLMSRQRMVSYQEFFNKENDCPVIVKFLYGLNNLEFQLFCSLQKLEKGNVKQLMDDVGRTERSLINRALNRLLEKGLIYRQRRSSKGQRGYQFVYNPISLNQLKDDMIKTINNWHDNTISEIYNIEKRFSELH